MTQLEIMFLETMISTMNELVEIQKQTREVLDNMNKNIECRYSVSGEVPL